MRSKMEARPNLRLLPVCFPAKLVSSKRIVFCEKPVPTFSHYA